MALKEILAPPTTREYLPPYYKRNALAFGLDMALASTAINFVGSTAVLPAFLATLTNSEMIVGLASGITNGAWLLPQLLIASIAAQHRYKKPLVIRAVWLSRPMLLLMALAVFMLGTRMPGAVLGITLVGITIFFAGDACASVPWFDLIAKALPIARRGRVLGLGQAIGGIGGILAGMLVRYVLGPSSPWGFPVNYAVLFAVGGTIFVVASGALSLIYEPEPSINAGETRSFCETLASIPAILRHDRPFVRMVLTRILVGFVSAANAFYVLYATRELSFPLKEAGLFISAQVVGSIVAGLVLSLAQDRWGPLKHMRLQLVLAILAPILGLCAKALGAVAPEGLLALYLALYFFLGLYFGGLGWPFFNWVLEYAPEDQRTLYVGLLNTLNALVMVAPALGGWVVQTFSYPAVFWLALAFGIIALLLSATLPDTRQAKAPLEHNG